MLAPEELEGRKLTASTSAAALVVPAHVTAPIIVVAVPTLGPGSFDPNPEDPHEPRGPGTPVIRVGAQP
jgi:hypothetical protein